MCMFVRISLRVAGQSLAAVNPEVLEDAGENGYCPGYQGDTICCLHDKNFSLHGDTGREHRAPAFPPKPLDTVVRALWIF